MHCYILGIGSNCGDRRRNVTEAIDWLGGLLAKMTVSDIYETPAVGESSPLPYENAVVRGYSPIRIPELERVLKAYEMQHGRDEASRRRQEVPVDIDIVCCDACILRRRDYSQTFFRIGYHMINPLISS